MKSKNWRTFYSYRPPSFTNPPKDQATMREQYVAWLREARDWNKTQAEAHVGAMAPGKLVSAERGDDWPSYQRKVTWLSGRTAVRVVPCFTSSAGYYGTERRTGGAGVTAYWIMHDGRAVDSYLTQARAMAKARELAAFDQHEAIEERPRKVA